MLGIIYKKHWCNHSWVYTLKKRGVISVVKNYDYVKSLYIKNELCTKTPKMWITKNYSFLFYLPPSMLIARKNRLLLSNIKKHKEKHIEL